MAKQVRHECTNCKYEHVDYLTLRPTWWCENPKAKKHEVGYAPKGRCRIFEPKEAE